MMVKWRVLTKNCVSTIIVQKLFIILLYNKFISILANVEADIFRQDIGDQMEIGITASGYKALELRCGPESMVINLETDEEFLGVIYTRGSFYDKKPPCFYDTGHKMGQKSFKMEIPFNQCNTVQEGNVYSNVLVLQHDKELIMPGDAAFNLECDFNQPRDITVTANFQGSNSVVSRITPVDADPSKQINKEDKQKTFESYTNSVTISAEALRRRKEEL